MPAWISNVKCGCRLTIDQEDSLLRDTYGDKRDCPVCGASESIETEWETEYDLDPVDD